MDEWPGSAPQPAIDRQRATTAGDVPTMSSVSSSGSSQQRREFLTVAEELSVLSAPTVALLREEADAKGVPPIQLALQKALVTPTQIEIIETLCRPLDIVPGYEILGVIGQGGMGVVFRAKQLSLNRDVAIKLVPLHALGGDVAVKRFEVEAQVVAKLSHPNIVAAYDFGKHEGRLYFVMELVDGQDADHHIRRHGQFDETTAWQIVRQTAAGLAHAQHSDVVHRDVKPANILLVKPPAGYPLPPGVPLAKLGDFGLAWLTTAADERTRLTATNITLGSPHYMAPEQLSGKPVDWRADIYSLGATAYHLLSGMPPFSAYELTRMMAMKLQGQTDSLRLTRPDITPTSADLVDELMAGNPEERPTEYGALIERIDDLIGQQGIGLSRRMLASTQLSSIKPPPPDPQAPTQPSIPAEKTKATTSSAATSTSRLPWLLPVVAIVLSILAALGIWQWFSMPGKPDLQPYGQPVSLPFEEKSFEEWKRADGGGWSYKRNKEGEWVLEGTGMVSRSFASLAHPENNELRHFQLRMFFEFHEARSIEVQVNLPAAANSRDGPPAAERVVLRVTPDGAQLGQRRLNGPFMPRSDLIPLAKKTGKHELVLERHTAGWRGVVDKQEVGFVNARPTPVAPAFQLVTEEGDGWFSDFEVMELRRP